LETLSESRRRRRRREVHKPRNRILWCGGPIFTHPGFPVSLTKKDRMREMTTLTLHSMRENTDQLEREKQNPHKLRNPTNSSSEREVGGKKLTR
jgi:hypothetical protein